MKRRGKTAFFKVAIPVTLLLAVVFLLVTTLLNPRRPTSPSASSSLSDMEEKEKYPSPDLYTELPLPEGLTVPMAAKSEYFYKNEGDRFRCAYLKGVNMGLTLPTTDLKSPDIPYETYMDWFSKITEMNCNTVKIFTIMNPDFYRAFYDYNNTHKETPLYLLQGLWFNENDMYEIGDAYAEDGKILKSLQRAAREALDILHGNSSYTSYGKLSPAIYDKDVSDYVAGFILGLEWAPDFIKTTNENNAGKAGFSGKYLKTSGASPFESFLCQAGDYLIDYETANYAYQHPVAFLNWQSTDPLRQDNEPFPEEDMVQLVTEHILPTADYYAGLFAAVDIYPYYPEFMNYQSEYLAFKNKDKSVNSYRGYLNALKKCYTVPVIVAEVGLSTSRGIAHHSVMGYNQGGLTEKEQGSMVLKMLQDIAFEGYAGSMIFSWQDEWFKQTWNTFKFAPEIPANRTPNRQSAEQSYGILAYEPREREAVCYPDGDSFEWAGVQPVINGSLSLSVKYDEAYLYMFGKLAENPAKKKLFIALSTTGRGSREASRYSLSFEQPTDFLISLDGKKNTRILTDAGYDYFYYKYSVEREVFSRNKAFEKLNSGLFNPIYQFTSNEIVLPKDKKTIPPQKYEAGLLRYGNGNPEAENYDSLADFCFGDDFFEFRIPWSLLNIYSPTEKIRLGNLYSGKKTVATEKFTDFFIGAGEKKNGQIKMSRVLITLENSSYHARLKQSYGILKEGLAELMKDY